MTYILSISALTLLAVCNLGHGQMAHGSISPSVTSSPESVRTVGTSMERFALDLLTKTAEEGGAELNLVLSPFSVWAMLVIMAEGSEGRTLTQLQQALRLPSNIGVVRGGYRGIEQALNVNTSTIQLATVNAIFTDRNTPVGREFEMNIQQIYKANLIAVDFLDAVRTTEKINTFISLHTGGRIKDIVRQEDLVEARLILTNAIFFKGQWTLPFNTSLTRPEAFYDHKGVQLGTVNMMFQKGYFAFTAIRELQAHVVELPYGKENRLSMYVILPRKEVSLLTVLESLQRMELNTIYEALKTAADMYMDDEVEVFIPRFSVTSDLTLNIILEKMGILDIFEPSEAKLSKITKDAYLSRIIHKATIQVNEEGTVASAATVAQLINKSDPPRFFANRPFAYFIVEKTTNIMTFAGTVVHPESFKF